ncbi:hypothetical protein MCEMSE15_01280 [Fimbriimonadaceae bacterium]
MRNQAQFILIATSLAIVCGCEPQAVDWSLCEFSKNAPPGREAAAEARCAVGRRFDRVSGITFKPYTEEASNRYQTSGSLTGPEQAKLIAILSRASKAPGAGAEWNSPDLGLVIYHSKDRTHALPIHLDTIGKDYGPELQRWFAEDVPKIVARLKSKPRLPEMTKEDEKKLLKDVSSKAKHIDGLGGKMIPNPKRKP